MIGRLLASAALAAILSGAALAQMPPPPANPGPTGSSSQMNSGNQTGASHTGSGGQASPSTSSGGRASSGPTSLNHQANRNSTMSSDRQTAQGRPDVAEKLNACEAKPMKERQACIDEATRGL